MNKARIENLILSQLISNEDYSRKVLPYIKSDYFHDFTEQKIFQQIEKHIKDFNTLPTIESLHISLDQQTDITEKQFEQVINYVNDINLDVHKDMDWLVQQTEKFCQDKAVYNAVMKAIQILDGNESKRDKGSIPEILSDALSVTFDPHVGHDYIDDVESRFEFFHRKEERIEFDLEMFNSITKGGLPAKTLNIILAGTGVGKSLFMCHHASSCLTMNKNVLYITMEMAEEKIAERIDANLLDISLMQLKDIPKTSFIKKMDKFKSNTKGKLIIKEYPTASASSLHFRNLLAELKLKRDFVPDIIFIDYLNICSSSRIKSTSNYNSYSYIKAIAEELRGLAVEYNVPIVSATQTTRSGFTSTDIGLEDTSESFGLPATADFMFALISTEELEGLNQILVKQLKNRYNDPTYNKKFIVGVDRAKMRLYDVEQSAQKDLVDSGQDDEPVFDTSTGGRMKNKKDFSMLVH